MPKKKKTEQKPKAAPSAEPKKEQAVPKKQEKKPEIVTEKAEPPFSDFGDPGFKIPKGEMLGVTYFNKKHVPVYVITYKPNVQDCFLLYEIKGETLTKIDKAKSPLDLEKNIKKN